MADYENIINFSLISILIIIIIHMLFKRTKSSNGVQTEEGFDSETPCINARLPIAPKIYNFHTPSKPDQMGGSDSIKKVTNCPINKNEEKNEFYLQKMLLGNNEVCPEKTQSKKDFHKDFFSFRDSVYNLSNWRDDPVDKVINLYLDGNDSQARRYPNMKIKDLFDNLTCGPNMYERQCVRLPEFDNLNPNGETFSYGNPGMYNTRNTWTYPNEKIMNGGEIVNGLYGYDKSQNKYLSTDALNLEKI